MPRDKVTSTEHARAQAASAFCVSRYPRAAVLTVDGRCAISPLGAAPVVSVDEAAQRSR